MEQREVSTNGVSPMDSAGRISGSKKFHHVQVSVLYICRGDFFFDNFAPCKSWGLLDKNNQIRFFNQLLQCRKPRWRILFWMCLTTSWNSRPISFPVPPWFCPAMRLPKGLLGRLHVWVFREDHVSSVVEFGVTSSEEWREWRPAFGGGSPSYKRVE